MTNYLPAALLASALGFISVDAFAQSPTMTDDKSVQLQAAIQSARDLLQAKGREPSNPELAARLEGVEKAVALAHDDLVRVPTTVDKAIAGLKDLLEERANANDRVNIEKFISVRGQFEERDKRADLLVAQQKDAADKLAKASADNIAAALLAQKDNADKSEKGLLESLSQQRTLFQSDIAALNGTINDLKSRLDRSEGQNGGTSVLWGYIVGIGGLLVSIVTLVILVFSRLNSNHHVTLRDN